MKSEELKEVIWKAGAHLVGVAPAKRFVGAPEGRKPFDYVSNAESVVVVGFRIPLSIIRTIPSFFYESAHHHFNNELRSLVYKVASYLEEEGFDTFPVGPEEPDYVREVKVLSEKPRPRVKMLASFSHRHGAVLAGLGEFTPASYVVVPKFGPRVRFASIITSAPLEPDPLLKDEFTWGSICKPDKCDFACIKACPAKALPGDGSVDHFKCRSYRGPRVYTLDYFKKIEELHAKKIPLHMIKNVLPSNYVSPVAQVCGICLKACPIGLEM